MKPKFKLGDKVIVQAIVEKEREYGNLNTVTKFVTKSIPNVIGIYIGYRTALTGNVRYGEDGPEFRATGKVHYYLVVTSDRKNPIKAHPDFVL